MFWRFCGKLGAALTDQNGESMVFADSAERGAGTDSEMVSLVVVQSGGAGC